MYDLDDLEKLEQAATPGYWFWEHSDEAESLYGFQNDRHPKKILKAIKISKEYACYWPDLADEILIIELRNAAPEMFADLQRLREENQELRVVLNGIMNTPPKDLWNTASQPVICWYQQLVHDMQNEARRALERDT